MIAVVKLPAHIPPEWRQLADDERIAAIAAFKGKKPSEKVKFPFKAYGHPSLRLALNNIFHFKCAYCESYYGATQPVAIEHYRPKGEVTEGKRKLRGYYWLAATWENLFPSCTDCNSRRTHLFPNGEEEVRGKGNEFPLANSRHRVRSPRGRLHREAALLLDPSSGVAAEDPALHFEFPAERDRAGLVRPTLIGGKESAEGMTSIQVYALDRPGLIKARRDLAERVLYQCRITLRSFLRHQEDSTDPNLRQEYEEDLAELRTFLEPDKPYLGMVRQLIAKEYPALKL